MKSRRLMGTLPLICTRGLSGPALLAFLLDKDADLRRTMPASTIAGELLAGPLRGANRRDQRCNILRELLTAPVRRYRTLLLPRLEGFGEYAFAGRALFDRQNSAAVV